MMNWIRNKPMVERKKMEPGAAFSSFENHWLQAVDKMRNLEESQYSEAALTVISHLTQMIALLRVARGEEPEQSCKHFWIRNQCSDKVLNWLHELKNKGLLLSREDDERLVMMLHALCELASRDGEILGYVRSNNDAGVIPWDGACSLASLLLEYSLGNELTLGETAKYSFILLIKLASRFPALEKSLSQENGIGYTNLVISGLCACFAQLPTYTHATSEQMRPFVQQLKFVDDISHAARDKVSGAIADCFKTSFLEAIIQPALIQSVYEEEAVVTRYLQTICELLTHPLLVQRLMTFVVSMIPTIFLERLNHPNVSVTLSTLSLISSLLHFYCEDFWFHLILKYLLPQHHRMGQLRKMRISDIDFHDSSVRFLRLIPKVVVDAIGPDKLTHHYVQYLNNESKRLASLDSIGLGFLTPTTPPTVEMVDSASSSTATSSTNNLIFPKWKLKYDGTDDTKTPEVSPNYAPRLLNGNENHENSAANSMESGNFSNIVFSKSETSEVLTAVVMTKETNPDDESDRLDATVFTNISLQPAGIDDLSSFGLSENSFDSMGSDVNRHLSVTGNRKSYDQESTSNSAHIPGANKSGLGSSIESAAFSNNWSELASPSRNADGSASFGPFMDCLLQQITNITVLDPDVILLVTELVSLIAGSRIPLVNSLFLDPALIIQPSYPSFASLLNRIQGEFDQSLVSNAQLLQDVWTVMSRERRSSTSSSSSLTSNIDDSMSISSLKSTTSISESIRRKMMSGANIAAKGLSRLGFNSPNASSNFPQQPLFENSQETLQAVGGQGYRYTTHSTQSPEVHPSDPQRIMATRAIYFTHWLLELAAICQQLCYKRT